ncbi:hypothetical protein [Halalkalibacter okhensis]|uniref:DUF3887 domain-containing protein n=1 Tax=Halalkalibacter okhensis TaxID=333138 RepID=A0A0B0IGE7_9BACI|nr:hypothetical protein [Halalkalibacter okhensis]KHF39149.1 hypothetical protein LQ50_17130 [Halalkalibacter okhensis]
MRRQTSPLILIVPFALIIVLLLFVVLIPSQSKQASKLVTEFYNAEQQADFASSWELLHPKMKERFSKSSYMQDRVHTFMNHFGADTYTYSTSKPSKIKHWTMTEESEPIEVYEVIVTKNYNGKYGRFQFVQYTYVSLDKEEPGILWDYKE